MKKTSKFLLLLVVFAVVLPLTSGCTKMLADEGRLTVETMGRGFAWLDTGTHASLADATNFVRALVDRQGLQIACIEEIAWSKGWIDDAQLSGLAAAYGKSTYGEYLKRIVSDCK